jgi:hypothetical protein
MNGVRDNHVAEEEVPRTAVVEAEAKVAASTVVVTTTTSRL